MTKRALILGVGGQDGSYMAEHLLGRGYEVHGFYRRSSVDNLARVSHVLHRLRMHRGDLSDRVSLLAALDASDPDEVYNLADQDHVGASFDAPEYSHQITAGAPAWLLEAAKLRRFRLLQPISATVFRARGGPLDEESELGPMSPYACAKAYTLHLCHYYRKCHRVFVACPILFNHDSARRKGEYLLHKIARAVARGTDLDVEPTARHLQVDIGWAPDYVRTMANMLDMLEPCTVCVGSGDAPSIGGWCDYADFRGKFVGSAPARPGPVQVLISDDRKARAMGLHCNTKQPRDLVQLLVTKYREELA